MSQSLAQIYLHIVFSTKERRPWLNDDVVRAEMFRLLGGICKNLDSPALCVGGIADHVHLLCRLGRSLAVSEFIKELKRESSVWVKTRGPQHQDFHWQNGYGAFSVSPSHVSPVRTYIENQLEHHRTISFQDEFRRLLIKYGVEWNERYVWD